MSLTPRRTFIASWIAGGVLFALTFISVISSEPLGFSLVSTLDTIVAIGIVVVAVATDLVALWALLEIGDFTEVNFRSEFKHFWEGAAIVTAGLLGSFVFLVLTMIAAFFVFSYLLR